MRTGPLRACGRMEGKCGGTTSGAPMPRLTMLWGLVSSSMARWAMMRLGPKGRGRVDEEGARSSPVRLPSYTGDAIVGQ